MKDLKMSLDDRMREYEKPTKLYLTKRLPLIVRIDGKKFSTFTEKVKSFDKSNTQYDFSQTLNTVFINTCKYILDNLQGAKFAYTQSDEISILISNVDYLNTEAAFNNELCHLISYITSLACVRFNSEIQKLIDPSLEALFDTRINVYPEDEVANYFVWRQQDCARNSLSKFSRNFFSSAQLHEKRKADMHEMLYTIGKNWATDLPDWSKNGSFITKKQVFDLCPTFKTSHDIINKFIIKNYEYNN